MDIIVFEVEMALFSFNSKPIIITVANRISNTYYGFGNLIEIYDKTKELENEHIIFDFSETTFIEANLSAAIGAIFENLIRRRNRVSVCKMRQKIEDILHKNGFLEYFNLGKIEDTYATTVQFATFGIEEKTSFQEYLDKELFPKITITMTNEYRNYLSCNLEEVYQNARQHGNTDKVYACGQWFPRDNNLKFTIANLGTTIPSNVCTLYPGLSDKEAIDWATKEGTTTKADKRFGGRGLFDLGVFIKENHGKLHIISEKGYWGLDSGLEGANLMYEKSFPGTIVNIEINLNDRHIYYRDFMELLSSDEANLERLLFN